MTVSSTQGVSPGLLSMANAVSSNDPMSSATGNNQDMFLQLMVTQLQYQDPMNPVDTTQMMSQNAQFEALTQMQNVAKETNQLLAAQMSFGAASMLGQHVTWTDSNGTAQSGTPTAVSFQPTGPVLTIGGQSVPITSITGVASTTTTTGTTTTGASTTGTTTTGTTAGATTNS